MVTGVFPVPLARAESVRNAFLPMILPAPGQMVSLSDKMQPPRIEGVRIYPKDPFRFDFIVNKGRADADARKESERLIRYFMAALTVSEKDLWVNLSPHEPDRIIPGSFAQTELGRDFLSQDYILKQVSASLLHPDKVSGKAFWQKIYRQMAEKYGTSAIDVPVDVLNKVWIMPEKAVVYEDPKTSTAYVLESRLKVMLDTDYMGMSNSLTPMGGQSVSQGVASISATQDIAKTVMREIIIPILENEVNEGAQFARLRQAYHSLIMAAWYKRKVKQSLLSLVYVDQDKTQGIETGEPQADQRIYAQYMQAFGQGVFNFIREELSSDDPELLPHKYFSGGMDMAMAPVIQFVGEADPSMVAAFREKFLSGNEQRVVVTAAIDPAMKIVKDDIEMVSAAKALGLKDIVQQMKSERKSVVNYRFLIDGKEKPYPFRIRVSHISSREDAYGVLIYFDAEGDADDPKSLFLNFDYSFYQNKRGFTDKIDLYTGYNEVKNNALRNQGYFKAIAAELLKADEVIFKDIDNEETMDVVNSYHSAALAHSQLKVTLLGHIAPSKYAVTYFSSDEDGFPDAFVMHEFTLSRIDQYQGVQELLAQATDVEKAYWSDDVSIGVTLDEQEVLRLKYPFKVISGLIQGLVQKAGEFPALQDLLSRQAMRLRVIASKIDSAGKSDQAQRVSAQEALDIKTIISQMQSNNQGQQEYLFEIDGKDGLHRFSIAVSSYDSSSEHVKYEILIYSPENHDWIRAEYLTKESKAGPADTMMVTRIGFHKLKNKGYFKAIAASLFKANRIIIDDLDNEETKQIVDAYPSEGMAHSLLKMTLFGRTFPDNYILHNIERYDEPSDEHVVDLVLDRIDDVKQLNELWLKAVDVEKAYWTQYLNVADLEQQQVLRHLYAPEVIDQLVDRFDAYSAVAGVEQKGSLEIQARRLRIIALQAKSSMAIDLAQSVSASEALDVRAVAKMMREKDLNNLEYKFSILGKEEPHQFNVTFLKMVASLNNNDADEMKMMVSITSRENPADFMNFVYELQHRTDGWVDTLTLMYGLLKNINNNGFFQSMARELFKTDYVRIQSVRNPETMAALPDVYKKVYSHAQMKVTLYGRTFPDNYLIQQQVVEDRLGYKRVDFFLTKTDQIEGFSDLLSKAVDIENAYDVVLPRGMSKEGQALLKSKYPPERIISIADEMIRKIVVVPELAESFTVQERHLREIAGQIQPTLISDQAQLLPAQDALDVRAIVKKMQLENKRDISYEFDINGKNKPHRFKVTYYASSNLLVGSRPAVDEKLFYVISIESTQDKSVYITRTYETQMTPGGLVDKLTLLYAYMMNLSSGGYMKEISSHLLRTKYAQVSGVDEGATLKMLPDVYRKEYAHSEIKTTLLGKMFPDNYLLRHQNVITKPVDDIHDAIRIDLLLSDIGSVDGLQQMLSKAVEVEKAYAFVLPFGMSVQEQMQFRQQYPESVVNDLANGLLRIVSEVPEFRDSLFKQVERLQSLLSNVKETDDGSAGLLVQKEWLENVSGARSSADLLFTNMNQVKGLSGLWSQASEVEKAYASVLPQGLSSKGQALLKRQYTPEDVNALADAFLVKAREFPEFTDPMILQAKRLRMISEGAQAAREFDQSQMTQPFHEFQHVSADQALNLKAVTERMRDKQLKELKYSFDIIGKKQSHRFNVRIGQDFFPTTGSYDVSNGKMQYSGFIRSATSQLDYLSFTYIVDSSLQNRFDEIVLHLAKFPKIKENGFFNDIVARLFNVDAIQIEHVTEEETLKMLPDIFNKMYAHSQIKMTLYGRTFPEKYLVQSNIVEPSALDSEDKVGAEVEFILTRIDRHKGLSALLSKAVEAEKAYWTGYLNEIDLQQQEAWRSVYTPEVMRFLARQFDEMAVKVPTLTKALYIQAQRLREIAEREDSDKAQMDAQPDEAALLVPAEEALDIKQIVFDMQDRGNLEVSYLFDIKWKEGVSRFRIKVMKMTSFKYALDIESVEGKDIDSENLFYFGLVYDVKPLIHRVSNDLLHANFAFQDVVFRDKGIFKAIVSKLFKAERVLNHEITNEETRLIVDHLSGFAVHSQLKMTLLGRTIPSEYLVVKRVILDKSNNPVLQFLNRRISHFDGVEDVLADAVEVERAYSLQLPVNMSLEEQQLLRKRFSVDIINDLSIKLVEKAAQYPILKVVLLNQAKHLREIADKASKDHSQDNNTGGIDMRDEQMPLDVRAPKTGGFTISLPANIDPTAYAQVPGFVVRIIDFKPVSSFPDYFLAK
ncbi:MAG: hypothetical protein V2A70_00460 [Candidatus Omnitrophota bacterium]